MSDWNTLHFFDHSRYVKQVVPDIKSGGPLLHKSLGDIRNGNDQFLGHYLPTDLPALLKELQQLDDELLVHPELQRIWTERINSKSYREDRQTRYDMAREAVSETSRSVLADFTQILTYLIFTECAVFNPYLSIGRSIFSHCINVPKGSLAEELHGEWRHQKHGHVMTFDGTGIIGCLSAAELKLMEMELEKCGPKTPATRPYFEAFSWMVHTASEKDWGLLAITNVDEDPLTRIIAPRLHLNDEDFKVGVGKGLIQSR